MNLGLKDTVAFKEPERHFPHDDWLSLTQVVTWIAFKCSVKAEALGNVPEGTPYFGTYTFDEAIAQMEQACEKLMQKTASGHITVFGRYVPNEGSRPESEWRELTSAECLSFQKYSPYEFIEGGLEDDCLTLTHPRFNPSGVSALSLFCEC